MKKISLIIPLLICSLFLKAQDIHFAQLYATPLTINPAQTGAENKYRAILNYRNQWASVTTPYLSMMASFDMNFKKARSKKAFWAAGIFAYNDKAGDSQMSLSQINGSVAYHIPLDDNNLLGVGLQGGYFQRSANTSSLTWGNQFDGYQHNAAISSNENFGDGKMAIGKADLSAGIFHQFINEGETFSSISTGLAVHHLNSPTYDYSNIVKDKLYYRWAFHSTAAINANDDIVLNPSLLYYRQGKLQEIYFGTNMMYYLEKATKTNYKGNTAIGVGAYYRWNDAVVGSLHLDYQSFLLGFSYDFNISTLKSASNYKGGFEVSLIYRMKEASSFSAPQLH